MSTNETKNGRKFIKMYDLETGEYLGPFVNMTHEEAHGKKPESPFEFRMDKEAWDKLKYDHDVDGDHVELSGPPVFDPIKETLEFKVDKEDADKIVKMLDGLTDEEVKEIARASKNAAEIFCRITDCTYDTFNRYASNYGMSIPTLLPNIVKSAIVTISCVSDLSEISLNVPLLVYALYYERYNNSILPSSQMDIVFDIVSAMLELKKEGMIQ
jgi:hypothetical protein